MPQYVVRPSVCLSVTFGYRDHIGWNTSKIISQLSSLRYLLRLTPTSAIWSNGNTLIIRVEEGWGAENLQYLWNEARFYDGLIGSRIRTFDSYQNQCLWMTLNGRYALLRKDAFYGAQKKWMKINPYYQRQKYRSAILVSRQIIKVYADMRIIARVPRWGASNDSWVVDDGNFSVFGGCLVFICKLEIRPALLCMKRSPSSAFQWSEMRDLEWPLSVIQAVLCCL